jgi:DNA-binding CsgD family transcriptional regulator/PAS domain-containing protein
MANVLSPQALSQLIGRIYDCALDPSQWEQALLSVRHAFDAQVAMLALVDRQKDRLLIHRTVGMEPFWLKELEKHVAEISHCIEVFGSQLSFDEPFVISREIPHAYTLTSPYMQECLKPQGIVDIAQYNLLDTPNRYSVYAVSKNEQQGLIAEREIELGGLLLPHIQRAVMISNVLDARTIERTRMAEALDALRCGVVLTDGRGAILHANRSGEDMLRDRNPITRVSGVLTANTPAAAAELREAIALAARDEASMGKTGLAISLSPAGEPPVVAHVLPLTGSELRTRLESAAVAAVFIGAPPGKEDAANSAAAAFDLTPAETRVLASLLGGCTLTQTAAMLGIAPTTAKSHLENIFAKAGVTRQADLMRLATSLVPPTKIELR